MHRLDEVRDESPERGATSTEYALLAGFITVAFATGAFVFGQDLRDFFTQLAAAVAAQLS